MPQWVIKVVAALGLLAYGAFALLSVFFVWAVSLTFTRHSTVYSLVVLSAAGLYFLLFVGLFRRIDRVRYLIRIFQGKEEG